MTVNLKHIAVVAAISLVLPGCSAIFGKSRVAKQGEQNASQVAARQAKADRPTVFTTMGRKALDAGSPGLAIEAFQRAVASGEAPAPALNGIGVAFARVGRFDLAQRYFQRASEIDPVDTRYQANLARLMVSPLFAQRHDGDRGAALLAQAEQDNKAQQAKTREAAAPGQLQRMGANQFFIRTAAPTPGAGPVRTAMVISRAKPEPNKAAMATRQKAAVADEQLVADDKATPRTIRFNRAFADMTKP